MWILRAVRARSGTGRAAWLRKCQPCLSDVAEGKTTVNTRVFKGEIHTLALAVTATDPLKGTSLGTKKNKTGIHGKHMQKGVISLSSPGSLLATLLDTWTSNWDTTWISSCTYRNLTISDPDIWALELLSFLLAYHQHLPVKRFH
uniref:28S ribosomal protein S24, mitochondrial n=1 Tax=Steinernema glaseri TaxID=37863 RepID=A0A1I7YW38_9BILA